MVALHFPPGGGSGVQRTLKHVKYLFEQGIDATVITAQDPFPIRDETLLSEIPASTRVIQTEILGSQEATQGLPGLLGLAGLPPAPKTDLLWPDLRLGWLLPAVSESLRASLAEEHDVIYSTHPPATAHLAGLILHRITEIPWIADFRDGWTLDPLFSSYGTSLPELTAAMNTLEVTVSNEANFVIVADDSMDVRGLDRASERRVTIGNGVDPGDFTAHSGVSPSRGSRMRLSHVGTLHHVRHGAGLFEALRHGVNHGQIDPARLEVRLVGWATKAVDLPDDLPVTATGYVDHARAIGEMVAASALLFYEEPVRKAVTGKVYEYLAAGRPILCLASPDNLGARLVRELEAGVCVDIGDRAAVAEAIGNLQRAWSRGRLMAQPTVRDEALRRFSRRDRAEELAGLLRRAAKRGEL